MPNRGLTSTVVLYCLFAARILVASDQDPLEFFENRIRPVLVEHCYKCHNTAETSEAGLALDSREGSRQQTENGVAVIPGDVANSLILKVLRHELEGLEMPEDSGRLDEDVIDDFKEWIARGAMDPRDEPPSAEQLAAETSWEAVLAKRKQWWSFQPLADPDVPGGSDHPVDAFVRARLAASQLQPAPRADRSTLLRRLSFVLTGLPPTPEQFEEFTRPADPVSFEEMVDRFLASPRYGERWARHWMDIIRYADSHGSEGDPAIPHAYRYRDYLIRALNADVPYDQLIREHFAGDLLATPRLNTALGVNESKIGTAHWRMVFHGFAPTDALDEKVRFVDDQINVLSKAFLGLTVSCARCHDHKFDPISQTDYYALFGILGSCRPALLDANTEARQQTNIVRINQLKDLLREQLAQVWLRSVDGLAERLLAGEEVVADDEVKQGKANEQSGQDASLALPIWFETRRRVAEGSSFADAWQGVAETWQEAEQKAAADRARESAWAWDFSDELDYAAWFPLGNGLPGRPFPAGDFALHHDGELVVSRILPAGVHTHSHSTKHRGFLASPQFELDDQYKVWFYVSGEGEPSVRYCVQHYPRNGTVYPIRNLKDADWQLTSYDLAYWQGDAIHLEVATAKDAPLQVRDHDRSWFGIREVMVRRVDEPAPQRNPREHLQPVFERMSKQPPGSLQDLAGHIQQATRDAIIAWRAQACTDQQALLLDRMVREQHLPNRLPAVGPAAALAAEYQRLEAEIPLPTRVPGLAESMGRDQPRFERGNHLRPQAPVARRFLEAVDRTHYSTSLSGRLELARSVADETNPLTSRVMVNRIWHYLFGKGLVETPDNFGKLGRKPSHPQLLDYLAGRFVEEGWSIKKMIRFLLISETWQAESLASAAAADLDPQNRLLSHANLRRLDAEAIRDAMLAVSGRLDETFFGEPVAANSDARRRSIYVAARRNSLDRFLQAFNAPVPFATKGRRDATNVPAQSLTLLNSPFVLELAEDFAARFVTPGEGEEPSSVVRAMVTAALGRPPTDQESQQMTDYVRRLQADFATQTQQHDRSTEEPPQAVAAWARLAHAIFNMKEFIYLR